MRQYAAEFIVPTIEERGVASYVAGGLKNQEELGPADSDSIDLSVGSPLLLPYQVANQAALSAYIRPGQYGLPANSLYTSDADVAPFYNTVVKYAEQELRIQGVTPANVLAFIGGEHLYTSCLQTIIEDPEDILLTTAPGYGLWALEPYRFGGKTEVVPLRREDDYRLTAESLDAKIIELNSHAEKRQRVRGMLFINPHNPMGAVYGQHEVELIAEVAQRHDLIMIDDQVYRGSEYDQSAPPYAMAAVPGMLDRTITVLSLSKAYGLPSLRAAVGIGGRAVIGKAMEHSPFMMPRSILNALGSTFSADLQATSLREQYLKELSMTMVKKRNLMTSLIDGIPGMRTMHNPESGFFMVADVSEWMGRQYEGRAIDDDRSLIQFLAKAANIRTLTNCDIMWPDPEQVIRLSYCLPEDLIIEGLTRIAQATGKLL